jgi:hypothetical protein
MSEVMLVNSEWPTTLYLSSPLGKQVIFEYPSFYEVLGSVIKQKIKEFQVKEYKVKKENLVKTKKMSYVPSRKLKDYRWRFVANQIPEEDNHYVVAVSIRPEKRTPTRKQLSKDEARNLLNEGLNLAEQIGKEITVQYDGQTIVLKRLNYDRNQILDISNLIVELSDRESMTLANFINNGLPKVLEIIRHNRLNFKVITDFLRDQKLEGQLIKILRQYGTVDEITDYQRQVPELQVDEHTMFVIPLDDQNKRKHIETKEFFLNRQFVSQHITRLDLLNNQFAQQHLFCEISAKTRVCRFYLNPSGILGNLDGFICLGDLYNKQTHSRLLQALYIFSGYRNTSNERLLIFDQEEVQFFTESYHIEFREPASFATKLKESGRLEKNMKISLILTKRPNPKTCTALVEGFKNLGVIVGEVYYIPSRWIRFVDGFIANPAGPCSHPYLILTERLAILKPSTQLSIFPQLFSLPVELLYPTDRSINETDLKRILWIVKKRLYRYYQIRMLSAPEPLAIWNKNRSFLMRTTNKNIPLRFLI